MRMGFIFLNEWSNKKDYCLYLFPSLVVMKNSDDDEYVGYLYAIAWGWFTLGIEFLLPNRES